VKSSLEDADVALLLVDIKDDLEQANEIFSSLSLKAPAIVVLNKTDLATKETIQKAVSFFSDKEYCKKVVEISALKNTGVDELLKLILSMLPEGEPFYTDDNLSDLPMKFFVSELIREKIFYLYQDEIPYHATVLVQEFKEKTTLTKITADIILQRETQKGIVLGEGGKMIKQLGTLARKDIEEFIGRKVFLELFVKVRPKWRDNEIHLREYGY
jgi:GTP-binding protein Era